MLDREVESEVNFDEVYKILTYLDCNMSEEARERFLEFAQRTFGINAREEGLKRGLDMVIADLDAQIKRFNFMIDDFPQNNSLKDIKKQIQEAQQMAIEERNKLF